jgi:hypothetical protein
MSCPKATSTSVNFRSFCGMRSLSAIPLRTDASAYMRCLIHPHMKKGILALSFDIKLRHRRP